MKKKRGILILIALLVLGVICGCSQSENVIKDTDPSCYVSFGDVKKEEFAQKLQALDIGEDTLLVGINTEYSAEAIEQVNELLEKEGYDFNVMFCRLPEQYLFNRELPEFFQYLEEQGIGMDILPICNPDLKAVVEKGLLAEASEKLCEDEKFRAAFPQRFWEITSVDGKNYGAGTFFSYEVPWAVNKKLMEKYGFTQEDLSKEITELEEVFHTVSEENQDSDFAAFVYEPRFFMESIPFTHVDLSLPIGYWHGEEGKNLVVNLFDTDKMKTLVETMNRYNENGYIKIGSDIPLQTSFFMHTDYSGFPIRRSDSLDTWTNVSGIELVRIPYFDQTTNNLSFMINAISAWSEKQEEALKFLTYIYTDGEASTCLLYGVKGEDGTFVEELSENIIYNRGLGNLGLAEPLPPYEDAKKAVLIEERLNSLQDSFLLGFAFDTAPVQKEVDAVRNLYMDLATFRTMFAFERNEEYGSWQEFYEAYRNELENAGIERIVDEMNRQIQEYLEK